MKTATLAVFMLMILYCLPPANAQDAKSTLSNEWIIPMDGARMNARIDTKAKPFRNK